jgi:hypothetical protein
MDNAGLSSRAAADQLGHANTAMTTDVYFGRKVATTGAPAVLEALETKCPRCSEAASDSWGLAPRPEQRQLPAVQTEYLRQPSDLLSAASGHQLGRSRSGHDVVTNPVTNRGAARCAAAHGVRPSPRRRPERQRPR